MKSAKCSGGTQVSSANAIGFFVPLTAPNNPTAFLRMVYIFWILAKSSQT